MLLQASPPIDRRLRRWLVAILLTTIFAALQIHQSLMYGTLAVPATYDDIAYYVSGALFLKQFYESGFRGLLQEFLARVPGSPLSSGLAVLGFSLFGIGAWAGPTANAIVLLLFVRTFLSVAEALPLSQAALLATAFLGAPLLGLALMQFRPDMICGLVIASGTLFIIARPAWLKQRREQVIGGLLFGAALWAKPHIFPLTLSLFAIAMLLASLPSPRNGLWGQPALACSVTTSVGILTALPYYAVASRDVVNYIWTVTFGAQASTWLRPMSVTDHILFYLTGLYGQQSLGSWLYMGMLVGIALFYFLWRAKEDILLTQAIRVAIFVLLAYLAVTILELKGPHGFPFAAIYLGATALASVALARMLGPILGWVFCLAVLAFSLWQFTWPYQAAYNNAIVSPVFAQSRWTMLDEAMAVLGPDGKGLTVYQATPARYLNESTLGFEYLKRGATPPHFEKLFFADLEAHRKKIAQTDFAIVPTPDFNDVFGVPTGSKDFRAKIIGAIEESGRYEPPVRIADQDNEAILIYHAKPDN